MSNLPAPHCSTCGAGLPLELAAAGGACPYCGASVLPDPLLVQAEQRQEEQKLQLEQQKLKLEEEKLGVQTAQAQADMMRHLSEMTAHGEQVAARAQESSRRGIGLYRIAIGLLFLIVFVRVAWQYFSTLSH